MLFSQDANSGLPEDKSAKYSLRIAKWIFAGLLLRLLLMPISLNFDLFQNDIVSYYYANYGKAAFDPRVMPFYYPPLIYMIKAPYLLLSQHFSADFGAWLETSQLSTYEVLRFENYSELLYGVENGFSVFRNIFISKAFYLFCDALICAVLIWIVREREKALWVTAAWMLNPVVLHSVYCHGGYDLIPTTLVVASLFFALRERKTAAIILLVLGGYCKVFPLLIIPPYILVAESTLWGRTKLLFRAIAVAVALYLILWLAADWKIGAVIDAAGPMMTDFSARLINIARKGGFGLTYFVFLTYIFWQGRRRKFDLTAVFTIPVFILFTFQPVVFRYWIWISPLVILHLVHHRSQAPLFAFNLLVLFVLRVFPQQSILLGLFSPLHPEYFGALPRMLDLPGEIVSGHQILRVLNFLFVVSSLALAGVLLAPVAGWSGWMKNINRSGKVIFTVLCSSILLLTVAGGIIKYSGKRSPEEQYFWIRGYAEAPDTLSVCLAPGNSLYQDFESPGRQLSALRLFLEAGGAIGKGDSLEARLSAEPETNKPISSVKLALADLRQSSYKLLDFGAEGTVPAKRLRLELFNRSRSDSACVRVGLIATEGRLRVAPSGLHYPRKDSGGRVSLEQAAAQVFNLRTGSSNLPEGWQLAMSLYARIPSRTADILETIIFRLTCDYVFLVFFLVLLLSALSGLIATSVLTNVSSSTAQRKDNENIDCDTRI